MTFKYYPVLFELISNEHNCQIYAKLCTVIYYRYSYFSSNIALFLFAMSWFVTCCCVFAALVIWWYRVFFKFKCCLAKYDGPMPLPIIGNLHHVKSIIDYLHTVGNILQDYGPVVKIWFGYQPRLIIADYRVAELVLGSTTLIEKSYIYDFFKPWLGTGLLTSGGLKWRRRRKLLTPAFHFKILEEFIDIFNVQSNILVKQLEAVVNKGSFDVFPYINLFALDVICEATMGTQIHAQIKSDSTYVHSVKEICRIIIDRSISLPKMIDCLYIFSRDYWKEKNALKILHGYSNSVIKSRRQQLGDSHENKNDETDNFGIKTRMAFLDLLLQCKIDGAPLSDEDIREEVDTFMFEGHDTTTSGISFTLYCLSLHSNIQARVLEEQKSICGTDLSSSPTYQNLQDMKYLEIVIKESLRLYPPVPIFDRKIKEDTEFDGCVFPKGLTLSILAYYLHRQEEMYPKPEKFDPERFTSENLSKRSPYAYVPFSAGPRNCIGQRFAMLEMKSVISKIVRHFEILPVMDYTPKLTPEAILKATNGILIRLKRR